MIVKDWVLENVDDAHARALRVSSSHPSKNDARYARVTL